MAQSVELLLDPAADAVVREQWARLAAAGLPSEDRTDRSAESQRFHSPHLTLYAADAVSPAADAALPGLVAALDLELTIGAVLVFGPRRGRCILVRSVAPTLELVRLQRAVAEVCGAEPGGQFDAGHWVPHVTLAHRVPTEQVGDCLTLVGDRPLSTRVTACRRWDGAARTAWLL